MSDSNSPISRNSLSKICALCGETYDATQPHVCQDEPTEGVNANSDAPPPPPSYFGQRPGEPDDLAGSTLAGRYELLKRMNAGGMGVVYKARHKLLNNTVAVKILLKHEDEVDQRRFLQEAQLASKINHPNTVYIADYGLLTDGRPYLVMEFLEGPTLSSILRRSPKYRIDMLRACKIAAQIARGMQPFHDKGVVHRDLKPENIFVLDHSGQGGTPSAGGTAGAGGTAQGGAGAGTTGEDFVKIVDFGIAKDIRSAGPNDPDAALPVPLPAPAELSRPSGPSPGASAAPFAASGGDSSEFPGASPSGQSLRDTGEDSGASSGQQGLTQIGASLGTPRYMAPEQVDGRGIEGRTDQYALGCILYQMIGGQVPFSGGSSMSLLSMHMFEPPKPLRQRFPELGVPESLDALVLRMLAKNRQERFASMREVAAALDREIELLSVQRGEKVAVSSGLAALFGGRRGTHVILRGRKVPLWAAAGLSLLLIAGLTVGGVLGYRQWFTEPLVLLPGELQALQERALRVLTEDVAATQVELRLGAMSGLAQTRDDRYRGQLEAGLGDPSPAIQAQAAEALGQLGDRRAVPALAAVLQRNAALAVRLAAAQALSALGDEQGKKVLESTLASGSEEARLRAAALLCRSGHEKALALLEQAVDENKVPPPLSLNFLTCLTQAGNEAAQKKLRARMNRGDSQEALLAAARLAQLGHEDGRAFLRERIRQPGPEQLLAARFLSAPDEPQVAELFRGVLRDQRSGAPARLLATEGLGLSGQLLDARLLGRQIQPNKEAKVQLGAAASILLLARNEPGTLSETSLQWARGAIADDAWAVRESAAAVIGDSAAPDAVSLLGKLLKDAHPMVRQSAARALGRRKEESTLLLLRDGLRDADAAVRQESLRSLLHQLKILGGSSRQALSDGAHVWVADLLARGSETEQTLARSLLFKLGDRSQLDGLRSLARSDSADTRSMVIAALSREIDLLLSMLKDSVFSVRFEAARHLAEAGDHRAVPVLKEALERKGPEAPLALALLRKLGETGELPPEFVEDLSAQGVPQRLAALESAARLPLDEVLPLLKRLARDGAPAVRQRVAEVSAELPRGPATGPEGAPGIAILRLLANDPDAAVRARAAALLGPLLIAASAPAEPVAKSAAEKSDNGTVKPSDPAAGRSPSTPAGPKDAAAPAPPSSANETAAAAEKIGSAGTAPQGSGTLIIEAPAIVEFQLDHGRWQTAGKQPISVAAGPHELLSLSGVQTIELKDKQTLTVQVPESQIEKLSSSGFDAFEKKDLRKSQKLLEKASALCGREHKHVQPCNDLGVEINYHLGQIYEAQEHPSDAMTAYQKVLQLAGSSRGRDERRGAAQAAVDRLRPGLGLVVIPKKVKDRCQEVTLYMLPGTHMIEIDGESQQVKVRAQETVHLGTCQ